MKIHNQLQLCIQQKILLYFLTVLFTAQHRFLFETLEAIGSYSTFNEFVKITKWRGLCPYSIFSCSVMYDVSSFGKTFHNPHV